MKAMKVLTVIWLAALASELLLYMIVKVAPTVENGWAIRLVFGPVVLMLFVFLFAGAPALAAAWAMVLIFRKREAKKALEPAEVFPPAPVRPADAPRYTITGRRL